MKTQNSIRMILAAAFAAVYAVGVVVLAPISFQLFQVRVADALLPLAMIFGWPAVVGLSIGAFVANIFGGLGPVDMIGGAIANFLATLVAWRVARRQGRVWVFVGVGLEIGVVTVIVGSYLSYLFGMPIFLGLLGVFLGSLVATGILGTLLFFALSTRRIAIFLKPYSSSRNQPNDSEKEEI